MNEKVNYRFYGDGKRHEKKISAESPQQPEPYVSSQDLIQAVNLSILLNRPLLLEGEAGCGKSRLARAVAYELGLPIYTWHVRSTSKAHEGLYKYDAILRLHDVHTTKLDKELEIKDDKEKERNPSNPKDYRKLGPLGKAFANHESSSVVLIDEIDKADIDFPNDLLTVLDKPWEFEIPETGETISASEKYKPIVIITSNKEKGNLPLPFLRRCIYHYVEFPNSEEKLKEIVQSHYQIKENEETQLSPNILSSAIKKFLDLRNEQGLFKKPGTSELLDWLKALENEIPSEANLIEEIETKLLFPGLLIKLRVDWNKCVDIVR